MTLIGDAGRDEGVRQVAARRDAKASLIVPGTPALLRPEALVGERLVDEALRHLAPAAAGLRLLHSDRDGEMGDAVEKVRRAVDRIDDPARLGRIARDRAALLHQEAPLGAGVAELLHYRLLGALVGHGHDVGSPLAADLHFFDPTSEQRA